MEDHFALTVMGYCMFSIGRNNIHTGAAASAYDNFTLAANVMERANNDRGNIGGNINNSIIAGRAICLHGKAIAQFATDDVKVSYISVSID
jgi:hypothetical protein